MKDDKTLKKLRQASRIIDVVYGYRREMLEIPALAVGIIYKNNVILAKGYGFTDINKKKLTTASSCFRIASISKIFTAISIMQLVEAGKIILDEYVSKYLPWFKSSLDSNIEKITIRQLLTHTSGIVRDGDTAHWANENFPDLVHIKNYIANLKLFYKPNARWKYSNLGYGILGAVIESVTGQSYEGYITENICNKLEMTMTSSKLTNLIKSNMAIGYSRKIPGQDRQVFPYIDANALAPATGLSSNVNDLLKFVSAQFDGNKQLLSEKSKQEMRKIYWTNKKLGISQTIGFKTFKLRNKPIYYHLGGFLGYRTNIAFDPHRQIGVVTLFNVNGVNPLNFAKTSFNIINFLLDQPLVKNVEKNKKYEGIYRNFWGDMIIATFGNKLFSFDPNFQNPLSQGSILKPVKENTYLIIGSEEIESSGELASFKFDKNNIVKKIRWSANSADFLKKLL